MPDETIVESLRTAVREQGARCILTSDCSRFRAPLLAEALGVWRAVAGANPVARRRDLTPQAMRGFVKKVAIFEQLAQSLGPHRYRARITGPEFALVYAEMTGRFLDDVVPRKFYARWKLLLDALLTYGAPLRGVIVPEAFNRDHSVLEMLLAPLADDDGRMNSVLFVGSFERGRAWADVVADEAAAE